MLHFGHFFVVQSEQVQLNREGLVQHAKQKRLPRNNARPRSRVSHFQQRWENPTAVTIEHKYGRNCVCNHRSSSDCSAITR